MPCGPERWYSLPMATPEQTVGSEYEGLFSEFYDVLHRDAHEAPAYVDLALETGGKALELGCGTGRLLIPMARAGIEITGVDSSPDMLDRCREKLEEEAPEVRERVTLRSGDLETFDVDDDFGLVFLACNTANHLLTANSALRCFRRAGIHLLPDGLFVVDNSVPDFAAMVEADGEEEAADYPNPRNGLQFVSRFIARFDFANQREFNEIDLEERDGIEVTRRIRAVTEMTWYLPREVATLMEAAGLPVEGIYGSLRRDPLTAESREMVVIARR